MKEVAIIGSGASATGLILGANEALEKLSKAQIKQLGLKFHIFDQAEELGYGLPYDPNFTGPEHLLNVQNVSAMALQPLYSSEDLGWRRRFFDWLNDDANLDAINAQLQKMFVVRFQRKFELQFGEKYNTDLFGGKNIFDADYKESEGYKHYLERFGEGFAEFHQEYLQLCDNLKERYFRRARNSESGFVPRIIYGIYLKQNFEKQLEKLKSLIGAENVVEHKGTEVVENKLDATKNKCEVKYKKVGSDEVVTQDFDLMTIGAGRLPYEAPENDFGGKYVSKIWPISNVDKAIDAAILQAKKEGKDKIKICVKGTSVSAVDLVKTIFFDGKFVKKDGKEVFVARQSGVEIEVDMVSRGGFLPMIRSGRPIFSDERWRDHYPQALLDVVLDFNKTSKFKVDLDFLQGRSAKELSWSELEDLTNKVLECYANGNEDKKVHLWQPIKMMCNLLEKAYENCGDVVRAKTFKEFAEFVEQNQNDYAVMLDVFSAAKASGSNAFEGLKARVEFVNGKNYEVWEHIFSLFYEEMANFYDLPKDEKLFYFANESIARPFDTAMPQQSAEDLIAYNEAGLLRVYSCGRSPEKETLGKKGGVVVDLGADGKKEYDVVLDSTGEKLQIKKTKSPAYSFYQKLPQSQQSQLNAPHREFFCEAEQYEAMRSRSEKKFGAELAKDMFKHVFLHENGKYYSDLGIMQSRNHKIKGDDEVTRVILLRRVYGANAAITTAKAAGLEVVQEFVKQEKLGLASASASSLQQAVQQSVSLATS